MNKLKIYKALLFILIIITIIVLTLIGIKYFNSYKTERTAKATISIIKEKASITESLTEEIDAKIEGYKVIGIIKIPKINLEYPILEETNVQSLNLSITKFWGNQINEIGNVTLAGHNNLNATMFGKLDKLQIGDTIELTDIQNVTLQYEVFASYTVDPNDISCILQVEENTREVTLITCKNGRENRLIVKAREIKK